MVILRSAELRSLLPFAAVVAAVERAALAVESAEAIVPHRTHLSWQENTLLTMPACADGVLGVKLVSVVPGNKARRIPVVQGVMVLSDAQTGMSLAIMNAAELTALRTGAVGALGLKHTTPADVTSVGVVGCGVQGAWQAIFACAVRPVADVFCFSRSSAAIDGFVELVGKHAPAVRVSICPSVEDLLARTSVVITATNSSVPVLPNQPERLRGKHFISIGSFKPSMQELPDAVFALAGNLVIDSDAARHEVGDVINPVARGILDAGNVFSLGEVIAGRRVLDVNCMTAFKSVGMAAYDLYVAKAMHEEAVRRGVGLHVDL